MSLFVDSGEKPPSRFERIVGDLIGVLLALTVIAVLACVCGIALGYAILVWKEVL